MKISDVGEFGLIDIIKENTLYHPENVVIGIGDDGAVYRTTPGWQQVTVIDTMVQDSHFIIGKTAYWYDVGFKSVASNLSDIAAMGAVPTQVVLSTALTPSMDVDDVVELYRGIKDICRAYEVNILGGDTVMSREGAVITVAAFGEIEAGKALRRSGAKEGDVVAVSHTVGDSSGGLDVLLQDHDGYESLKKAHQCPVPRIELGRLLVQYGCHSLNDISDGLASEANEIAKASGVELVIDGSAVPTSSELQAWAAESGKHLLNFVFNGGEDYELVFTMAPDDFKALQQAYPDVTPIGTVRAGDGRVLLQHDGKESVLLPKGWDHFERR